MRSKKAFRVRNAIIAAAAMCIVLGCVAAMAQGGPPSIANPDQVWEGEAKAVAKDLSLSAEQTGKLVEAYKAARVSHQTAMREKMSQRQGGRPDFSGFVAIADAEKAKLETALKGFLNADQTTKAMAILGTLSRRWDSMVAVLDSMGLDEKTKAAAMKVTMASAIESEAMMRSAMSGQDRGAMRDKFLETRNKLNAEMAKVLNPDQMAKWNEAMSAQRGGRRGAPPAPAPESKPAEK